MTSCIAKSTLTNMHFGGLLKLLIKAIRVPERYIIVLIKVLSEAKVIYLRPYLK